MAVVGPRRTGERAVVDLCTPSSRGRDHRGPLHGVGERRSLADRIANVRENPRDRWAFGLFSNGLERFDDWNAGGEERCELS